MSERQTSRVDLRRPEGGVEPSVVVLSPVPRVALRWPDEVAAALGVSPQWLYDHGFAAELRVARFDGKVRLVLVSELERVLLRLSARWDE